AHIAGDVTGVEPLGDVDRRPPTHAFGRQLGNDRTKDEVEIATNDVVIATRAMAEFAGDVAVGLGPPREVPEVAGRDGAQVERVLTRIEAQRDHAVFRADAP